MNATETVKAPDATIASTQVATATKAESSSQGRVVSKAPEGICPSWLKKALLVAAVVASLFALAFAIAVTAGLSGVTVLGLSGFAKTISATITTYGALALVGLSFIGAITSLSCAILKLSSISREEAKAAMEREVKRKEEAIRKEEAMLRKKMAMGEFAPFKTILAEEKPLSNIAIQVFFEFILPQSVQEYTSALKNGEIKEDENHKLVDLFSKISPNVNERAAWAALKLWDLPRLYEPPKECSEAIAVLKRTAEEGSALPNCLLASCYYFGHGFPFDRKLAMKHFEIAANQELPIADLVLAGLLKEQVDEAADRRMDENDRSRISQKAMKLALSAAAKNLSQADLLLGAIYREGKLCEKDLDLSMHYYQRSAEQNNADALYFLARGYLEGKEGFLKDKKKAKGLLEKAAALGHNDARLLLRPWNDTFWASQEEWQPMVHTVCRDKSGRSETAA